MGRGKPDSFLPLNIADYLADTSHLTVAEHGAYMLLLMHYWRTGGPIPDDDGQLSTIAKTPPREWRLSRKKIRAFFHPIILNTEPCLVQNRCERELARAHELFNKKSSGGKSGNEKRWAKSQNDTASTSQTPSQTDRTPIAERVGVRIGEGIATGIANASLQASQTDRKRIALIPSPSPSGSSEPESSSLRSESSEASPTDVAIPEFLDRRPKKKPSPLNGNASNFAHFYDTYPLHKARRAAEKAYISALKRAPPETILEGAKRYADDPARKPEFTKMPATWLNADCWLDEQTTGLTDEYSSLKARFEKQYTESSDGNENRET